MKVYTSYFGNSSKLAKANVMVVGITLYPPKWFYGPNLREVAPTPQIFAISNQPDEVYNPRFRREVLGKVNPQEFYEKLKQLGHGKDVALCCYEKPDDKCHRFLVAEWLEQNLGIEVPEFGVSKNPKVVQADLFG